MRKSRVKIIPDKVFHRLWDAACKAENERAFIQETTGYRESGRLFFDYKKCNMDYVEAMEMLTALYRLSRMELKEIMEKAGVGKATLSDTFCFPIRTVEEWYKGSSCSHYIRLMILRHYHLLILGKYIKVESEIDHYSSVPPTYKKDRKKTGMDTRSSGTDSNTAEYVQYKKDENTDFYEIEKEKKDSMEKDDYMDDLYLWKQKRERKERTVEEREFFKKYGFYP